jgi:uncharacterized repeat protein (TIGR01451 family)
MSRARTHLFSSTRTKRASTDPSSWRSRGLRAAALVVLTGSMAGTMAAFTAAPAEAATGSASGRVFRDYNLNGVFNTSVANDTATEVGISGVTVRAYDSTNAVVATTTTSASGQYTLSYNTATSSNAVRLEFDAPTGMVPSRSGLAGATSDTTVQFVSGAATGADLGLAYPQDYAPQNPTVAFARQVGAIKLDGTTQNADAGTLFTNPYNARGTTASTPATKQAELSQTGAVWGVSAYDDDYLFSSALFKRHAPVGPGGLGAIYRTTVGGATDASVFATVGSVGTNPRPAMTNATWFNDTAAYSQVGKIGLGGMTLSPDHSALYVVNLNAKTLVRIPVTRDANGVPQAGTQTSVAIPSPSCTGVLRPFGVSQANGSLWVTQTCAATAQSNLRGYVYRYDYTTNTFATTPTLEIPLTGARGNAYAAGTNQTAAWRPWSDDATVWPTTATTMSIPQPLLSDVQLDSNGDMSVGIKDRFGDQAGFAGRPGTSGGGVYEAMAAGDTLRACRDASGTFVLESNGSCGPTGAVRTGYGVGNGDGPGGGEFYSDDFNAGSHDQVSLGGLLQVPGFPHLVSTVFDPKSPGSDPEYGTQGYRFWSNANGSFDATNGWRQVGLAVRDTSTLGRESTYGKAGGMGDLDLLVTMPVEIGNRVWIDTDRDGVQDAGEPGVANVQVSLLNAGGTVVGTTTTSAAGEYFFNDSNVTGGLVAGAAYRIRLQRPTDFTGSGPLAGYQPTTTGAGTKDTIDSDATIVSSYPQISITAPSVGANHDHDFGFVRPSVSVGDFVWHDVDRDGIQTAGEPGIQGVTVTITGPGGAAVTDVFGNAVTSTTTNASGAYTFANLPALATGQSYTVAIDNNQTALTNAGYVPTITGVGTAATDSSNGTAASGNLTTQGASDTTLDFGFVKKAVSVGDFVWHDTNRDGIQTAGEPGIANVVVTITKADGSAVTTVNGTAVTQTTTDASGKYSFDQLPAGVAYKVSINNNQAALTNGGYVPTITGAGTTGTDSSNGTVTSAVLPNNGDSDLSLDFGFVRPAVSVGDFVWVDTDRDGIQDAGEPGISGVTVTLSRTDGQAPRTTTGANATTSTTTNASGAYGFANLETLPTGVSYRVTVDNNQGALTSQGYVPTLANQGSNTAVDSSTGTATAGALTTNGASDTSLDFGFVKKAVSVGDFVWIDLDKNGVQDSGEPGLPGVTVTITGPGGAAVTNVNGVAVTSTITDANGRYTFPLLPAGVVYTVSVNNSQPALADYLPTQTGQGTPATDSSNGSATSANLPNNGDADTTLDFGFRRKSVSVGDFVWVDTNRDGIQQSGEPGINGVTVTITRTDGAPVKKDNGPTVTSTTTNAAGSYSFSDLEALPAGVFYRVAVDGTQTALSAYVPTVTGQGTAATDSSTGTATSGALTTDGGTDFTLDFGFVKPAVSVGDLVWFDTNGNGIQDSGEPGIQGVVVTITKADGSAVTDVNGNAVTSTTTGANGRYTFGLLPAGVAYKVSVDNGQAALFPYVPTQTGQGTTVTDSSTGSVTSTVLATNGASDTSLDFGFVKKKVSVGDLVWVDTNRDGIQQSGEPGINGVTVTITRTDGAPVKNVSGASITSTTTNASGAYTFANLEALPAGTRYVTAIDSGQAALNGYVPTLANQGSNTAVDSSTGSATSTNLATDGASDTSLDFGFVRPAVTVGDTVFVDTNGNGTQNSGEPGLPGVTVTIVGPTGQPVTDVNGNPVGPQVTTSTGSYSFPLLPTLPPGQGYTVVVNPSQPALEGFTPTNNPGPTTDLTGNGDSDLTQDFGFKKKSVSVGDFVWVDTNRNGVQDSGEPGIQGVTVTIERTDGATVKNVAGTTVTSTTTNASGAYLFSALESLPAGTHYNTLVNNGQAALAAYVPTITGAGTAATDSSNGSAESGNLTTDGASDLTLDFGFVRPAITVGDFVWADTNGNGVQDSGEPGIPGVTVTITKADGTAVTDVLGNAVTSTTTGANGQYTFPLLPAGVAYTVSIDGSQPALFPYTPTATGAGTPATDSSTGSATSAVVTTNGGSDLTLDFGFVKKKVSVGDYVWVDTNRNGIQNSGEPGIQGVTVTIERTDGATVKNVAGATVTSTTTDSFGAYLFANLEPLAAGTHYVTKVSNGQAALSAYVPTITGAGTTSTDSSNGSAESGNLTTDGASDLTLDFGFVRPAVSVGDFVWFDANGNGVQDSGEAGIQGVVVTITKGDGTAVTDVNGAPVSSTTTGANGQYTFGLLPAGVAYKVSVDGAQAVLFPYAPTVTGAGTPATDSSTGSATSAVLAANGASDTSLDFGFVKKKASVGDYVWLDTNRDGVQQSGEPGINGVTVTIERTDSQPVKNVSGATVTSTTTNASGLYLFANLEPLAAGTHYVTKVSNGQAALSAYVPTITGAGTTSTDSSNGSAESGNLTTDGASDLTLDFGFVKPAVTVGDFVWFDANGNGIQDAGEAGIAGVTVRITYANGTPVTDVNGNAVTTTVTGGGGGYLFANLPAGQAYRVTVDNDQAALNEYAPTQTGQGTPATDSSNGTYTTPVLNGNGTSDLTADFGFKAAAPMIDLDKIASTINDLDGNGPDAGDTMTFSFVVTNIGNRALTNVTLTDAKLNLTNVACGTGTLAVGGSRTCTPVTYTLTQADVNNGAVVNTATAKGTAPNGTVVSDDDSTTTPAVPQSVSVGDFVWVDTDRDGIQDTGEPGIQGVTVTIVGPTGAAVNDIAGNPVGPKVTDGNGTYLFAALPILPAGSHYTVKVDNAQAALSAYVPTLAGVGSNRAVDSSTGSAESVDLTTNGASDMTLDFGFVKPAVKVGDLVWVDTNGNGVQDAGEPGLQGVTVRITKADGTPVTDVNGNPVTTVVTGPGGAYVFDLLPAGVAYTVTVDNGQAALSGFVPTQTGQGTPATDSSNGSYTTPVLNGNGTTDPTADFGFKAAAPAVRLVKTASAINDLDGNGPDAGDQVTYSFVVTNTGNVVLNPVVVNDPLFPGAAPNVTCGSGPLAVGASRTCTSRTYTLTQSDVNAGKVDNTATVRGTAPNGTVVTDDDSTSTPVVPSKVSVGDFVWVDTNRDGLQTAGEPGLSGVTVTLVGPTGTAVTDVFGNAVGAATTGANGQYTFANLPVLPAGQRYTVKVDTTQAALAAYVPTPAGVGSNRAVDSSTGSAESVDLTTHGASDTTLDFGFVKPAVSVGDFVWVDTNGNGVQDAGEPGINGVVVRITTSTGQPVTDVNGNVVGPVTTNGGGAYLFPLLPAGVAYTVTVDNGQAALSGYVPTQTGQGTPATDSSNGSYTTPVLNGNGTTDLTADFGFRSAAPMVRIDKVASAINDLDGNGPDAGDQITYSFVVTNMGNVALDPVVVSDPLFPGGTGNITCGAGALAVGASRTCTSRTYTLTQTDVNAGGVNNTATVRGTAPNGSVVTDDDSTTTPVAPSKVSVGDFVWVDTDRDGIQDAGEPGIQGVRLTIVGPTGAAVTDVFGNAVGAATTGANGQYTFANLPVLPAGQRYTVKLDNAQVALAAYVPTLAGVGSNRAIDSSTGSAESVDLTTHGASDTTLDFGFVKPAVSVGDFVWVDTNGNGIQDAGEPGIQGVTVRITKADGTPVTDVNGAPVTTVVTGANGQYVFPLLPAGTAYTVTVDNGQAALTSYVPTTADQGGDPAVDSSNGTYTTPVLNANGASDPTADFGFKPVAPAVEIDKTASAINDVDGNGPDAGDTITYSFAVTNTGNVVLNPVVVSDPLFAGGAGNITCGAGPLAAGATRTCTSRTYTLTQTDVNAGGVNNTATVRGTAPNGTVVTDDDSTTTPVDPQSVSVGDFVWVDTDRDGIQDAGEPGIQGVKLTIVGPTGAAVTDIYGNAVGAATTNAAGAYLFANLPVLPAGQHYTVRVDNAQAALSAYVPTIAGAGANRAIDSSTSSAESGDLATNGASDLTLDFGFVKPAVTVGDTVFADTNGNGTQNAGEPGIPGVTVTITGPNGQPVTDVFGNPVGPQTTNGNGTYLFPNLPALPAGQGYTVVVNPTQPALTGYHPTNNPGPTGPLTTNGAQDLTKDFGFQRNAVSVGDFVWVDTNRNGVQNAGEPGLPGVTVTITKVGGAPVTDVLGNVVGPKVTDANGAYEFTNLPDGVAYVVKVDNTQATLASYVPTQAGQGGNPANDSSTATATSSVLNGHGASDRTLDFGFVKPAVSVGDLVWVDSNGNGVQDSGEPGLPGVVVTITSPGGAPVTDVYGNTVGPVTTGANGQYTFGNLPALPAGQGYTVRVDDTQPALASYTPSPTGQGTTATDSSNGTGTTGDLTTDGASDTTVDFGFVPNKPAIELDKTASSINDLDGNGPDAGDTITYGFKVTNTGNAVLRDVTVTDPMFPAGVTCPAATLAPGASFTCTAQTYTLTSGDVDAGRVDNTATAKGTSPTGTVVTDTDSTTTPVVPIAGRANVKITKTVDDATPAVGDTVTYTLRVENTGDSDADDVVVTDLLPAGVTFVSADAPCTQAARTVTCNLGTLEPGQVRTVTVTATVDNVPVGTTQERHRVENVSQKDAVLDVEVGQTATGTVTCDPGYVALDGSARIVSSGASVTVLESRATGLDTWKVTLRNTGTERAQTKVFAACATVQTETVNGHSHQLQVAAAPVTRTVALPAGRTNITLDCASGTTPVQPGWVLDGNARVVTSYPLGSSSWVFGVDNAATGGAGNGTFSLRCVDNRTSTNAGHSHQLDLAGLFRTLVVPAGQTVTLDLACQDAPNGLNTPKGIVAGYNLAHGLLASGPATGVVHQGNEPRPVIRAFTLTNPTSGDLTADLYLLCLGERTQGHNGSGDVVNTATVSTTSPERTTNDNSSSATFRVTGVQTPAQPKANLRVSKTVDDTTPRVGDSVTYTLTVTNDGPAAADDVQLVDVLPDGVTFESATTPCTLTGATVGCDLGTIAAGATRTVTITAKVAAAPAASTSHGHDLDVQKVEQHVPLAAGETRTVTVDCAPGYLATDGSGRVDQIDQGTGTQDAVRIIASRAVDEDTWSATLVNTATGNAQGKVFAVCAKKQTEVTDGHSHGLVLSAPVAVTGEPLEAGTTTVDVDCATGRPIAPSFSVPVGSTVRQSRPVGASRWTFVVDSTTAGTGDFSVRCLDPQVATADGHQHDLSLTPLTQSVTVAPGQTVEVTSTCAGDAKGVVAGWAMDKGLVSLGNDPRPIVRVFRFYNPTNTTRTADVFLLCLRSKTSANTGSGTVVNTAYATTSTPETTTGDNTASASFRVDTSPVPPAPVTSTPAPTSPKASVAQGTSVVTTTVACTGGTTACKGTALLVAAKTQRINGTTIKKGTVLARTTFTVAKGKTLAVKMKPTAAGKRVLKAKALKTAQVKIGAKVRTVRLTR